MRFAASCGCPRLAPELASTLNTHTGAAKHWARRRLQPRARLELARACPLTLDARHTRPAPGVTEFCVDVEDELSGSSAKLCVTIVVPNREPLKFVVPLEPAVSQSLAECPDAATMAQIAADYAGAFKAQPGVTDLEVNGLKCSWIVSAAPRRAARLPGCQPLHFLAGRRWRAAFPDWGLAWLHMSVRPACVAAALQPFLLCILSNQSPRPTHSPPPPAEPTEGAAAHFDRLGD